MNRTARHLLLPAAAAAALGLAACGGGGANTNASTTANQPGPQQAGNAAYRFAACMRAHGLANFPDPIIHQSAGSTSVAIRITPALSSSPNFNPAQKACNYILPQGKNSESPAQHQKRTREFVAFAQCLRSHGYTNFPDPNSQGELNPQQIAASGVNVHAPGFFDVAKGCLPALGGTVSVAQLQAAIAHVPAPGAASPAG